MCSILVFAYFFLLGITLGLLYDLFKLFRIFVANSALTFLLDILYFVICSLLTFVLSIYINSGIIRGFVFYGEFFGFIIYKYIFGRIVFKFMRRILFGIKIVRFFGKFKLFIFNNNKPKKWIYIIFCNQKIVIFFYIFKSYNQKSGINTLCPVLTEFFKGGLALMKVKILKGKRKRYKGIVVAFLLVILTNVIGAFAKQRIKIANLSKKIFEIEKKRVL